MNLAEQLKGGDLKVTAAQQDDLAEGNYYYRDIVGLQVETQEGRVLGKITEIMTLGLMTCGSLPATGRTTFFYPPSRMLLNALTLKTTG